MIHGDTLPLRPRLAFLFRVLHEQYALEVDAALRDAGFGDIRPGQAKVLPFVPRDGMPVKELAALAGVRKQTMAQAVDQLVRAGYLERRPNPSDARSRLVLLTPRGEAARPIVVDVGQAVEDGWADLVGPDELEGVRTGLRNLLEHLQRERTIDDEP